MMDRTVKNIALRIAVLSFFALAAAGWISGCNVGGCAWRAFIGSVAIYFVVRIAGVLIVKILIEAMVESQVQKRAQKGEKS